MARKDRLEKENQKSAEKDNKKKSKKAKQVVLHEEKPSRHKEEQPPREKEQRPAVKNSFFNVIAPYFLMIFAIVMVLFFVLSKSSGVIGFAVQNLLCGLIGYAAYLLPAVVFYIGLKWCLFNIRWSPLKKNKDATVEDFLAEKRRLFTQIITGFLLVLFVSIMIAVIFDRHVGFSIKNMWTDYLGGGVIGGSLGLLMLLCFDKTVSIVIISLLSAITFVFMIGLTPDYIVSKIQENRRLAKERRAIEAEEEARRIAEEEAEERKHRNRMAVDSPVKEIKEKAPSDTAGDDEPAVMLSEPELKPLDLGGVYASSTQISSDDYIGTDGSIVHVNGTTELKEETVGSDFGGDPAFDTAEYAGIQSVIDNLGGSGSSKHVDFDAEDEPESADDEIEELRKDNVKGKKNEPETIDLGHIENEELLSDVAAVAPEEGEQDVELVTPYVFPPVDLLSKNPNTAQEDFSKELQENAQRLMETLNDFKISIKEVTYSRGPTITRYELRPEAGIRVRAIANLVDDIALNLATTGVRIEAPIPNKPAVGIEVPNRTRATVYLRDLIDSPKFFEAKSRLTACLGMDVGGNPIYFDVSKMPHLLIAGATGMGKSVCINTIIVSMLYKAKPEELKLILIDPKKVEFAIYKNIPHLYAPIVSDPKKAAGALASAVAEMERRFELIEEVGVRDIAGYNAVTENDPDREFMPQMVIIIDELADLMMTASKEVEASICRLAQKARAAGIHIIIGTQRPSVDVITGLIKANIPSRIACTVASQTDSRTILDIAGAEKLIGRGDMLFAPVGASKPMRVQGAFVSDSEVESIVTYIRDNNAAGKFNAEFINRLEEEAAKCGMSKKGSGGGEMADIPSGNDESDSKFTQAVRLAIEEGKISTSLMQRRLGVGYGRAAKIIDEMEDKGYVSKADGNKPRRVLISMEEFERRMMDDEVFDE